jgi:serine/threonine protein kinase
MSVPATVDEFLAVCARSGLLPRDDGAAFVAGLRAGARLPDTPPRLAEALVGDGLLTAFQARNLLLGKWRNLTVGGKYVLLDRIGSGGMGSVYLCLHKGLNRAVALKVLPDAHSDDPASVERFHREARAAAALDHPNIVRAHDLDREGRLLFLVMEYVDGVNLQDLVARHGPLGVTRACHYIRQAARGLEYAHAQGLIHRDIKPANLLVDRSGTVKLLDLGLARFFEDDADDLTRRHEGKGSVLGTADYIAPEQALDSHTVDHRADVYSLGATFYFLLTGRAPFPDGSVAQKLISHQMREPKPIGELRPDVPAGVARLVGRMMAKGPEDRPRSPGVVAEALVAWAAGPVPPPRPEELPAPCTAAKRFAPAEPARSTPPPVRVPADAADTDVALDETPAPPPRRPTPEPVTPTPRRRRRVGWAVAGGVAAVIVGGACALLLGGP